MAVVADFSVEEIKATNPCRMYIRVNPLVVQEETLHPRTISHLPVQDEDWMINIKPILNSIIYLILIANKEVVST